MVEISFRTRRLIVLCFLILSSCVGAGQGPGAGPELEPVLQSENAEPPDAKQAGDFIFLRATEGDTLVSLVKNTLVILTEANV